MSRNSHQIDDTDDDDGEDPDSALPTLPRFYLLITDALNALKIVSRFYKTRESDEQILNEIGDIENNLKKKIY